MQACAGPLTHAGTFQAGINVYWDRGTMSDGDIRRQSALVIRYALSLRANSIMLSFPFFVSNARSDGVEGNPRWTPSARQLGTFLAVAQSCRINVTVRPLLGESNLVPRAWRGSIQPSSPASWFLSYENFILPYLRVLRSHRSASFVLGTELNSLLQYRSYWAKVIRLAKTIYNGTLAYDRSSRERSLLAPVVTQADVWPSIRLPANVSQHKLDAAWESALHSVRGVRGIVISEFGMAAVPDGYAHPARWYGIGSPTPAGRVMQARWFIAACRAALSAHVSGIYWWRINFDDLSSSEHGDQFSFYNTPAQHVVKECFDGGLR